MEERIKRFLRDEKIESVLLDEYLRDKNQSLNNKKKISGFKLNLNRSPLKRNRANTICLV